MNEMEEYRKLILSITDCEILDSNVDISEICVYSLDDEMFLSLDGLRYNFTHPMFSMRDGSWDVKFAIQLRDDDDIKSHLDNLKRINTL